MISAIQIRAAQEDDLTAVKALLDMHRHELGFVPLPAVRQALERGWLYVATSGDTVLGMIDWWARRDNVVVLYNIVVAPAARERGVGRRLLDTLIQWAHRRGASEIRLKCPVNLPSNAFYARTGFRLTGAELGRRRPLNCWALALYDGAVTGIPSR